MGAVADFIEGLRDDAESYGVSPAVFVGLYLITWPFWYVTLWLVVSSWHRQDRTRMRRAVGLNRVVTVIPYAYVLIAGGRNMPWTWYAFAILLPLVTTTWFLHKLKDDLWFERWWEFYVRVLKRLGLQPREGVRASSELGDGR
jgi:hypothetical protein